MIGITTSYKVSNPLVYIFKKKNRPRVYVKTVNMHAMNHTFDATNLGLIQQ